MKFVVCLMVALAALGGAESARMQRVGLRSSAKTVVSGHSEGKGSRVKYTRAVHATEPSSPSSLSSLCTSPLSLAARGRRRRPQRSAR